MTTNATEAVAPSVTQGAPEPPGAPSGIRRIAKGLFSKPAVALSAAFIVIITLMALFAPFIVKMYGQGPYDFNPDAIDSNLGGIPLGGWGGISAEHWFGVEPQNGRDIFARIVYGARISLAIALAATLLTTVIGVVLGMLAGFYGGWIDQAISRLMDFLMAFPALIFMIALLSALPSGNRPQMLVIVLSVFNWPYMARVIRGQTMTLANREFVEAAYASGASRTKIVFHEILPNLSGTIIVMSTLAIPGYIGTEAGLSFLGVGVTPPTASWGQMIATSVGWFHVVPTYFLIPGFFLFLTVLSFTVFGDRLKKVMDFGGDN